MDKTVHNMSNISKLYQFISNLIARKMNKTIRNTSKLYQYISKLQPTIEHINKSRSDIVKLCSDFQWPVIMLENPTLTYLERTHTLYEDRFGKIILHISSSKIYISADISSSMYEKILEKHGFSPTDRVPSSVAKVLFFIEHIDEVIHKLNEFTKLMKKTSKDSDKLLEQIKDMSSVMSVLKAFS